MAKEKCSFCMIIKRTLMRGIGKMGLCMVLVGLFGKMVLSMRESMLMVVRKGKENLFSQIKIITMGFGLMANKMVLGLFIVRLTNNWKKVFGKMEFSQKLWIRKSLKDKSWFNHQWFIKQTVKKNNRNKEKNPKKDLQLKTLDLHNLNKNMTLDQFIVPV